MFFLAVSHPFSEEPSSCDQSWRPEEERKPEWERVGASGSGFTIQILRKIWVSCFHSLRMRRLFSRHSQNELWGSLKSTAASGWSMSSERSGFQQKCSYTLLTSCDVSSGSVSCLFYNLFVLCSGCSVWTTFICTTFTGTRAWLPLESPPSGTIYWFHFILTYCGCSRVTSSSSESLLPVLLQSSRDKTRWEGAVRLPDHLVVQATCRWNYT